jgi:tRNA/rRNA methyltransferase
MLNCGLTDLRLVKPRPSWPHPRAVAAAAGADIVLDGAKIFATAEEAIADLHYVYATTARPREGVKPMVTAHAAAAEAHERAARRERSGFLFGPERTGLENDEVSLADAILRVPVNPEFSSLNLAQAVLLAAYEWRQAGEDAPPRVLLKGKAETAAKEDIVGFFTRLEAELDACGFLRNAEMRPTMVRNIRNIFHRAGLMAHEVRTLQGILTGLTQRPHAPRSAPKPRKK